MCIINPKDTLLGKAHLMMDDARTKLADKSGLAAPRDFGSEWINGKGRSMYGKAPKPAKTTSPNTGLQIPTRS